jgi:hypothetical protein
MNRACLLISLIMAMVAATVVVAAPGDRLLFDDTFDTLEGTLSPYHWQPLDGSWIRAQRSTRVLRQESEEITADSWALALWTNYSVVTKCLGEEGEGPWGLGLTAYDDTRGRCYRLRLGEGRLYLEKVDGTEVRVLADAEAKSVRGKWFSLRLALTTSPAETTLTARVWGSADEEPKEWLLTARDTRDAYRGGLIGLWTGNCAGRFSYLSAKRYSPNDDRSGELLYGTDFADTATGRLPAFWRSSGGLWVKDGLDKQAVLRQMIDQSGPMYDENAFAYLDWTGYTVSCEAIAHPGSSKWGVGLVGYYGPGGSNYRLRALDNKLYLVKRGTDGRLTNLAMGPLPLKRGVWYHLKLALDNLGGAVRLQGRVWEDETEEPTRWQLTAYDRNEPLRSGAPGLWCFGSAVDYDNFQVQTSALSALNETLP